MSELSILELETEHAELLPEREALSIQHGQYLGGHNHVDVHQVAIATAGKGDDPVATASNNAFVVVG
jgi:hypothetical protein